MKMASKSAVKKPPAKKTAPATQKPSVPTQKQSEIKQMVVKESLGDIANTLGNGPMVSEPIGYVRALSPFLTSFIPKQAPTPKPSLAPGVELLIAISDKTFESGWGYFNKAQMGAMIHPSFVEMNSGIINPANPSEVAAKTTPKGDEQASAFRAQKLRIFNPDNTPETLEVVPPSPVFDTLEATEAPGSQQSFTFTDVMGEATSENNLVDPGIVDMAKEFIKKNPTVDIGLEILTHRQKGDHLTANSVERASYLLQEETKAAATLHANSPNLPSDMAKENAQLKTYAEHLQTVAKPITQEEQPSPVGITSVVQKMPIPPELFKKRFVTPKYNFEVMTEVGHTIFAPGKTRKDLASTVSNANRKFKPARFGTKEVFEDGVMGCRIWRLS